MTIQFFIDIDYAFRLSSDLKGNLMPNGIEVLVSIQKILIFIWYR